MARIRTIKPEFWTSEQIVECSPNSRLLFIGLWNFCDDGGVHPASPARAKMQIFPGDPFSKDDVQAMIDELIDAKLIQEYEIDGKAYWRVSGWKHQRIDQPTYRFPQPDGDTPESSIKRRTHARGTESVRRTPEECSIPEGKGREGNVKDKKPSVQRKRRTADRFEEFWSLYPVKRGKAEALKKWKARRLDEIADRIIADVNNRIANDSQWKRGYAPYGSTYVNQSVWEDETVEQERPQDRSVEIASVWAGVVKASSMRPEQRQEFVASASPSVRAALQKLGGIAAIGLMNGVQLNQAKTTFIDALTGGAS